jgi:hypothetical protein
MPMTKMTKIQKWLSIAAICFVTIYLGAIAITLQSRTRENLKPTAIESTQGVKEEKHLILPELFLPMIIILTLAGSFLVVKRRNAKNYQRLDDDIAPTANQADSASAENEESARSRP